uniref:biotin synthase n=1 Tax=Chromera velia CCMP2878 TaxID=1169474 RepID=A0A0G4GSE1_9ALVE|eukprot:Cvel_5138.t1-p1 / transcript=Cvel_5138.t1 / gene=Cvel_5138 / organism=Chromera_velia_CCMP2878 / gene_product=Biotin synthase, putative / transcript_product=Biotin synthase, putative / location=Cvel_scaffold235:50957-52369(+) / protein_length=471 / sequence_SO=supercontig / SO=protein_coding / is_pseudo=false
MQSVLRLSNLSRYVTLRGMMRPRAFSSAAGVCEEFRRPSPTETAAASFPSLQRTLGGTPNPDATIRHDWTREEIKAIYDMPLLDLVYRAAAVHRQFFDPREVQRSTLLSIKTGGCSENCGYCSQSQHHKTFVKPTPTLSVQEVLAHARVARMNGSTRFCMGSAWREVGAKRTKSAFKDVLEMVKGVRKLGMECCVTLGMLTDEQAKELREAGLTAYNHNLDTSPEYYPKVVSTRTYEDRLKTLENVRSAGISVCCGGIVGMGEEETDRVGLLQTLATLPEHPESVPINALVPVEGTPLGDSLLEERKKGEAAAEMESEGQSVHWTEMVRMIATARVVMPASMVRLSAGRKEFPEPAQALMFMAGANSLFTGDTLLTTANPAFDADQKMLDSLGLKGKAPFTAPLRPPGKASVPSPHPQSQSQHQRGQADTEEAESGSDGEWSSAQDPRPEQRKSPSGGWTGGLPIPNVAVA